MKDRELIKKAMAFAVKDITGRTLRDAALKTMVDDFNSQDVCMGFSEYFGRVYESHLYRFEVHKLKDWDSIHIKFTDKREKPFKEEYWDNTAWMMRVLDDNLESLKELPLCKQCIKETKHVLRDLVNIGWLK